MRALVQKGQEKDSLVLKEIPEPKVLPGWLKVKVMAAGVCGTDVHGISSLVPPVVLGHEFSGEVVEVGEGAERFSPGDRVTSETTVYHCGQCPYCNEGHFNLCPDRRGLGSRADGGFAQYVVIPHTTAHTLPDHLSYEEGALFEPFACAVHGVIEQAGVQDGEGILVLGPGPLGILVGWLAGALGARVVLAGKSEDKGRLHIASRGPLSYVVDIDEEDLTARIGGYFGPYGVDRVFECTGALPAVELGLELLRKRGMFIQMGIIHKPVTLDFDRLLFSSELLLTGSRTQKQSSWLKALDILNRTHIPLKELITHVLPLESWREGFDLTLRREAIKVILHPWG